MGSCQPAPRLWSSGCFALGLTVSGLSWGIFVPRAGDQRDMLSLSEHGPEIKAMEIGLLSPWKYHLLCQWCYPPQQCVQSSSTQQKGDFIVELGPDGLLRFRLIGGGGGREEESWLCFV